MSNIIRNRINALKFCNPINVSFSECTTKIIVHTDATMEAVTFYFEAFNGKRYLYESITDVYGLATIDLDAMPYGLFTAYSGVWRLTGAISGTSERVYFLSNYGRHPELRVTVREDYYSNITAPSPFPIDTVEYVCCCDSICKIDPCAEEEGLAPEG